MKTLLNSVALVVLLAVSPSVFAAPTDAKLIKHANISKAEAEKTALAKVPNGTIQSGELEREHGKVVWSFDISTRRTKNLTEVQVDAKSGDIVSIKVETPADQAAEAAADTSKK